VGGAFVVLDPTASWVPPADLLEAWVRRAVADGVVVAGVLPVTDTVKEIVETPEGPVVGVTHDRERLRRVVCLVLPGSDVPAGDDWPPPDLGLALASLRDRHEVVLLSAVR
jgi:glycine/D-amino acid oxidase-like deaminating enzyme